MILTRLFIATLLFTTLSPLAHAGAQSFSCVSKGKGISFAVGNEGDGKIRIKFVDKETNASGLMVNPVTVMPNYGYAGSNEENSITVMPVANAEKLYSEASHLKITHADGSTCNGREMWTNITSQKFLLAARDGDALTYKLDLGSKKVEGLTDDGYISVEMFCKDTGVTSSGGCNAQPGDTVEVIRD